VHLLIPALVLVFLVIVVYLSIDLNNWLDRESKSYLISIAIASALAALIVFYIPSEYKTAAGAIYAATLASIGWVVTNHQTRIYNRILYTNAQIDQYRNDVGIQNCVYKIRKKYINAPFISDVETDLLLIEYLDGAKYGDSPNDSPIMYSIVHLLNYFERSAYLYQNGLVDRRLFYRNFNIILGKQIIRLQHVVRKVRRLDSGKKSYNDLRDLLIEWYDFDIDGDKDLDNSAVEKKRFPQYYGKIRN
jgi:hypothetical protein